MNQNPQKSIIPVFVILLTGFNIASSLLDLVEIFSVGLDGANGIFRFFTPNSLNFVTRISLSLILVLLSLLFLGILGLAISVLLPGLTKRFDNLNTLSNQILHTLRLSSDATSSSLSNFARDFFEHTRAFSFLWRVVKYTTFAFVFVWISGFVWMLAKVRYPNSQEMQFFWQVLKQSTLLGSILGIWIGCVKLEIGKGPFYLTHATIALLIGTSLGLFVLPGNIFLPWLIVSILGGGSIYLYYVFFVPLGNYDKRTNRAYPIRYPTEEDIMKRGIRVPIFFALLIAFLSTVREDNGFIIYILSLILVVLSITIASHVQLVRQNKVL